MNDAVLTEQQREVLNELFHDSGGVPEVVVGTWYRTGETWGWCAHGTPNTQADIDVTSRQQPAGAHEIGARVSPAGAWTLHHSVDAAIRWLVRSSN